MDRIAPTVRPKQRLVMRQNWRDLLFLHWRVDAATIQAMLPPGLTVDTFDGDAYIGLIPFRMRDVRPVGFPAVHGLSHFCETNVRTYVHHNNGDPGVWFFSLYAANWIAVKIARRFFHLPYYDASAWISHQAEGRTVAHTVTWRRYVAKLFDPENLLDGLVESKTFSAGGANMSVDYKPSGTAQASVPGSLEHFLAERYILYAYDSSQLSMGRVHHTPYPLQSVEIEHLKQNLVRADGIELPDEMPIAHYAAGVDVEIFPLVTLPAR